MITPAGNLSAPVLRSRPTAEGGRIVGSMVRLLFGLALAWSIPPTAVGAGSQKAEGKPAAKVSYYRDIRPILQANCQGCHQPAKSKGGYVMTDFKKLLAGGDSEGAAIVPKQPEKSAILKMVTPQDGEVRMPKDKTPLLDTEVTLVDRKSTRLNSSHIQKSRMPSSA